MVWGLGGLGFGAWGLRFTELPFAGVFLKSSAPAKVSHRFVGGWLLLLEGRGFALY